MVLFACLGGCTRKPAPAPPPPPIRYVLGPAWQAGEVWFYPREIFNLDATGIADTASPGHADLTTDNEPYDPDAMAAAMPDVQLPAIATVTDLDTGRQVMLRVNDRGAGNPARLIVVTPRVAALLGMNGPARVRVQFDQGLSMALSRQVQGSAADLAIETAPRADVRQTELTPLAGASQARTRSIASGAVVPQAAPAALVTVPLRLSEQITQTYADPGVLMIAAGTFTHEDSARRRRRDLDDLGARLVRTRAGGQTSYAVQAGPYGSIAEADAALARTLQDGVTDARIVIDLR